MKLFRYVKLALYVVLAVLCVVLKEPLLEYPWFFIGGLMSLYAVEVAVRVAIEKGKIIGNYVVYWALIELIVGVTMIIGTRDSRVVFVTWAIWGLLREAYEIMEELELWIKEKIPTFVGIIESIVAIVLSVMLLLEPTEHHALIHVYYLVVELVLAGLLPIIYEIIKKKIEAREKSEE